VPGRPTRLPFDPHAARTLLAFAALLVLCGCPGRAAGPAAGPAAAVAPSRRLDFARDVLPVLEERCSPCHFPGGRMHERLPFEQEGTVRVVGTRLFTRLGRPEDQAPVRAWLEQEAGSPREDPPADGGP